MLPGRFSRWLLAALLLALLSACTRPADDTIRFGLAAMPVNLDPRFATDAAASRIGRLLFQRLVEFDPQQKPVPGIATWQRLGPRHYRFRLQEGLSFHDGSPLTSADVEATLASVLNPDTASPHRGAIAMIERMATPDARTIDFFLDRADPLFPGYLVIGILPRALIDSGHRFERQPVGSGPFRFVSRPGEGRLRLQRLRDGQMVEFVHVPNPTVRSLKLLRGEIDILQNDLPPELVAYLERQDSLRILRAQGSSFAYLGFNLQDPLTGQLALRRAIAHAIDREAIIEHVFAGTARPANALLPPTHWAGNPELRPYRHDPQQARQLLAEAGFELPVPLVYKTSSDPFRVRIATIVQSQLAQAGIELDIRSYDWGTFYGDIKAGRFQLYSLAWIGIKSPDIFRYVFHSSAIPPAGANRGHFVDAEVDTLIEAAEASDDLARQAELYRRLQARLLELLPYVPLWYEDHVAVVHQRLRHYQLGSDGNYDGLNTVELKP